MYIYSQTVTLKDIMRYYFSGKLWLGFTILAAVSWGFWGILTKFISGDISPYTTHFLFTIGAIFTLPLVLRQTKTKKINIKAIAFGTGAGILAILGNVSVYQSFRMGGKAAVVIPFTNLYPLVTVFIALLIFKEKLNRMNILGIFIVVPTIVILSGQSQIFNDPVLFFKNLNLEIWIFFALLSLLLFGLFSASQKVISNYLSSSWSYISFVCSSVLVSVCFITFGLIDFNFSPHTFWVGSLAGLLDGIGVLAIYLAYSAKGQAAQVSSIGATLQQFFTVLMAISFLNEKIDIVAVTGIVLAIVGAFFLSIEKKGHGLI